MDRDLEKLFDAIGLKALGSNIFYLPKPSSQVLHLCGPGLVGEMKKRQRDDRSIYWCDECGTFAPENINMLLTLHKSEMWSTMLDIGDWKIDRFITNSIYIIHKKCGTSITWNYEICGLCNIKVPPIVMLRYYLEKL